MITRNRNLRWEWKDWYKRVPKTITTYDPTTCNTDISMWEPNPFGTSALCSQKLVKLVPRVHKCSRGDAARAGNTEKWHQGKVGLWTGHQQIKPGRNLIERKQECAVIDDITAPVVNSLPQEGSQPSAIVFLQVSLLHFRNAHPVQNQRKGSESSRMLH